MQSMDAATREEFAALRRRAYGPNADIADDPVALARLRELEERHDRGSTPATAARMAEAEVLFGPRPPRPESSVAPAPHAPSALDIAVSSAEPQRAEAHARATPTPPRIGRALLIGWAASIVVVAIVVGALVFGLASLRPVSAVTGARQVASLDEPAADVPMALPWARNGDRGATFSFAGLLIVVTSGENRGFEGECVTVLQEVVDAAGSRMGDSACSAKPFHPAVSIQVTSGSSDELTAAFPVGTVLQFVWDGTAVAVFAADPPAPTSAPA